ncbi:hypothetical protein CONLIGDRAFT_361413 [Coniochaeta ligniaria NRRL 30616]|uniref:Uncharacterized protein n=1 Tax=Coniochaeta ligniaria NRRL 30616 TaxID=1408157 RepID=A0A1J7JK97_9PEZI|nr:hypothetical protein CONLIGDRAFT_361413 [Coniochaeta ligniaria NRRL 30616]
MPHSQHDKDTSAKQKRRRSISHHSKGKQDKPKQPAEDVVKSQPIATGVGTNAQPPVEQSRPWSPWIPGDDGRWFYQGRLKADGSGWEYQFTEGYPPTSRRLDANAYATVYQNATQTPSHNPVTAVHTVVGAPTHPPHTEPRNGEDTTEQSDDDDHQEENTETYTQAPPQILNIAVPQLSQAVILATSKSGSGRQAVAKQATKKGGKNLSAIVKADKERRIHSRKRVKRWLSEVTP